jgi:hypothetical protein
MERRVLSAHQTNTCPKILRPCPYVKYGCKATDLQLSNYKDHVQGETGTAFHLRLMEDYIEAKDKQTALSSSAQQISSIFAEPLGIGTVVDALDRQNKWYHGHIVSFHPVTNRASISFFGFPSTADEIIPLQYLAPYQTVSTRSNSASASYPIPNSYDRSKISPSGHPLGHVGECVFVYAAT